MSKLFIFAFLLLLFLPAVLAEDIAYVLKNPSNPEQSIISSINEMGYTYKLIDESQVSSTDFSKYLMILLGDENINNVPVNSHNSLVLDPDYYSLWSGSISSVSSTGILKAFNLQTFIADSREFEAYTKSQIPMYYLSGKKSSTAITVRADTTSGRGYFVVAIKREPRRAFFGITETDFWTQDSKELFKKTLEWVLFGEDYDNDGFNYDVDCNDKDAGINPDAEEIPYDGIDQDCDGKDLTDIDGDGFDSYEAGGQDCNDYDASINPSSGNIYENCVNDAPIVDEIGKITVYETETVALTIHATDPENDELTYYVNDARFVQDAENPETFTWETDYNDAGIHFVDVIVSDSDLETIKQAEIEVKNKNQAPVCGEIPALEWNEDETAELDLSPYCYDPDGEVIGFYFNSTSDDRHIILGSLDRTTGIAGFSSEENWAGDDWIVFKITDGKSETLTNPVELRVISVNDAPQFSGIIENLEFSEDTNLKNGVNLSDYFSDPDSELEYAAEGNSYIRIEIKNAMASFYPEKDWYGTENIVFSADDGEYKAYSNAFSINILDANEPPELIFKCESQILEDNEYECDLIASDFENDEITLEIVNKNNLNCAIEGSKILYSSYANYNGDASCIIRAKDDYGHNDYEFDIYVEAVNDAPEIISFSPGENTLMLLENTGREFSISAEDIDSEINISWMLDQEKVSESYSYVFNKPEGSYVLEAVASDSEYEARHLWQVIVGSISEFTCSDVNGFICSEKQICNSQILNTMDSTALNPCCSSQCTARPPEFKDARVCKSISNSINLAITEPGANEEFMVGDIIKAELEIDNNAGKTIDFDADVYLYDLTDDKKIDKETASVKVKDDESGKINIELKIDSDIDDGHEFAVFAKINGDDFCTQKYSLIKISREDEDVRIKNVEIPDESVCGDFIDARIFVENYGSDDANVKISIENRELGISETSEEFELESYDGENSDMKILSFEIPANAKKGTYKLMVSAFLDGNGDSQLKEIKIGECKKETSVSTTGNSEVLNLANNASLQEKTADTGAVVLIVSLLIIIGVIIAFFII